MILPPLKPGLKIESTENKKISGVEINGLFIAIGHKPNTHLFKNFLNFSATLAIV